MLWWHWCVLGAMLLVIDIALVNVYFLIWFGAGAMLVGGIMTVVEIPLWAQILSFSIFSAFFLGLWISILKPRRDGRNLEKAREQMPGQAATVIRFANGKGKIRLQRPVGTRDVWEFSSDANHHPGDLLVVTSVSKKGVVSAEPQESRENEKAGAAA